MIKNITVHPKGATHFQTLNHSTYFLKEVDEVWMFRGPHTRQWLRDEILNDVNNHSHEFSKQYLVKIGATHVSPTSSIGMPPVAQSGDCEDVF